MATQGKGFVLGFVAFIVIVIVVVASLAVRRQRTIATVSGARMIEEALEGYREDNGFYPTAEQGLRALVSPPRSDPLPAAWAQGGYVDARLLTDPWGRDYLYEIPGRQNPDRFDVYSLGRDGRVGGTESDTDLGNFTAGEE